MKRDFSFNDIHLPLGMNREDIIIDILQEAYPNLRFFSCFDIEYNNINFVILDKNTRDTLKKFKFDRWDFKYDGADKALDEIVEWCENYYDPKPEPIVKKVEVFIKPHHCECCGAPMPKGIHKCEYCGTEYY